jgi:molybdopterin converting factor small subunit
MSPSTPASPGAETVTVRFWASARAAVGVAEEELSLGTGASVREVIANLAGRHGERAGEVLMVCSVLLDGARLDLDAVVPPGGELEFLPPFAGG